MILHEVRAVAVSVQVADFVVKFKFDTVEKAIRMKEQFNAAQAHGEVLRLTLDNVSIVFDKENSKISQQVSI